MLLGDPKKAIVRLAVPIFFSLIASGLLHLTDMIWVSGLGPESLSAVGFFVPLYMLASALATGIGVGAGTCISQRIGAGDKEGADHYAAHMMLILAVSAAALAAFLLLSARPVFAFMGADTAMPQALAYSNIMTASLVFLLFTEGAYAVFRSEGNAKSVMKISVFGVVLNMILDPILIYPLEMGVAGAAWASVAALFISTLICGYVLLVKKETYITVRFKGVQFRKDRISDILHLGLPVSINQVLMGIMIFAVIKMITHAGGETGVAVFSTGLRYMHFLVLPLAGISSAAVTVVGAAFGAQDPDKIQSAFDYSLKLSVAIAGAMMLLTVWLAPTITLMFTWSEQARVLSRDFIVFLRIVFLGHPPLAVALVVGSVFIGLGRSIFALILEVFRILVFTLPLMFLLGIGLKFGLPGMWAGMALANVISALMAVIWVRRALKKEKHMLATSLT